MSINKRQEPVFKKHCSRHTSKSLMNQRWKPMFVHQGQLPLLKNQCLRAKVVRTSIREPRQRAGVWEPALATLDEDQCSWTKVKDQHSWTKNQRLKPKAKDQHLRSKAKNQNSRTSIHGRRLKTNVHKPAIENQGRGPASIYWCLSPTQVPEFESQGQRSGFQNNAEDCRSKNLLSKPKAISVVSVYVYVIYIYSCPVFVLNCD